MDIPRERHLPSGEVDLLFDLPMNEIAPQIIPALAYEDVPAAVEWLTPAFGFRERAAARLGGVHAGAPATRLEPSY